MTSAPTAPPTLSTVGELRSRPGLADLPVVLVSADTGPASLRRASEAGATDRLAKPLVLPDLLAVLDEVAAAP